MRPPEPAPRRRCQEHTSRAHTHTQNEIKRNRRYIVAKLFLNNNCKLPVPKISTMLHLENPHCLLRNLRSYRQNFYFRSKRQAAHKGQVLKFQATTRRLAGSTTGNFFESVSRVKKKKKKATSFHTPFSAFIESLHYRRGYLPQS